MLRGSRQSWSEISHSMVPLYRDGLALLAKIKWRSEYSTENTVSQFWRFLYVIGLHAVQFGNNWMKKIPRTAKILLSEEFLNLTISKLDKHVVLLLINYIASQTIQLKRLFPERKKYSNSKLT